MNDSERRIPVQYAKRVVGRKMYGGQSTHIPIKVAMSGVMPIIFASSILSIPSTIQMFVHPEAGSVGAIILNALSSSGPIYAGPVFHPDHHVRVFLPDHPIQSD